MLVLLAASGLGVMALAPPTGGAPAAGVPQPQVEHPLRATSGPEQHHDPVRAYPRAAPGLASIDADVASGALTLTGRADAADGSADLWIPERCPAPAVAGSNVGPADNRQVLGGWRVAVPIVVASDYRISVTCAAPTPPETPAAGAANDPLPGSTGRLPATGSEQPMWPLSVLLVALALGLRRWAGR